MANLTGFRVAATPVHGGLPEVHVPAVRVYVHPPEQDRIISAGLLKDRFRGRTRATSKRGVRSWD